MIAEFISLFPDEVPTVYNCFFIKNYKMWYFIGTSRGRLIGLPVIGNPDQIVVIENEAAEQVCPLVYMNYFENVLIASWENGRLCVYTLDNLDYTVTTQMKERQK